MRSNCIKSISSIIHAALNHWKSDWKCKDVEVLLEPCCFEIFVSLFSASEEQKQSSVFQVSALYSWISQSAQSQHYCWLWLKKNKKNKHNLMFTMMDYLSPIIEVCGIYISCHDWKQPLSGRYIQGKVEKSTLPSILCLSLWPQTLYLVLER